MKLGFGTYALMVSIILWGVLLGGVVYSHIVFFPVYLSHLPESAVLTNGEHGLNEGNFWRLLHPLLLLSLIVTLATNWRHVFRRKMIAVTLVLYFAIIVISFIYFIPQLGEFHNSPRSSVSAAEWLERGDNWQRMSWIRGGTLFVLAVPLLLALARPRNTDGNR